MNVNWITLVQWGLNQYLKKCDIDMGVAEMKLGDTK